MRTSITPQTIITSMLDGSAVLFVGAGLSFLSTNKNNNPLPNGDAVKHVLHTATGTKNAYTLEKISGFYVKKLGSAKLYEYLTRALTVERVDRSLTEFYKLPWRRIYTTNYDNAIEFARHSTRGRASFTLSDRPREIPDGAVIHINGSIESVSPQTISDDLRLTDYSYATSNFQAHSEWTQLFLNDLRVARGIVFTGYSLADLDVARLLATTNLQSKTIFYIAPDADEVEVSSLEAFGTVNTDGIESLFEIVNTTKKSFTKAEAPAVYYSIIELNGYRSQTDQLASSVKVHEQLVYGTLNFPDVISDSFALGRTQFNIPRSSLTPRAEAVARGDFRDFAIVGDLASGKTFAALQAAKILIAAGYKVYWVQDGRKLNVDFDQLSRDPDKVCVIVDGYGKHLDAIRTYIRQRPNTHVLIVTERSATHEIVWPLLREHLPSSLVPEVVLDSLTVDEIPGFEELTNFTGLWNKDLAGRTSQQRRSYIENTLNRSLYRLLLEILKSEKVRKEIETLLAPINENEDIKRFFTTAFIVGSLGYNFWINDWQNFYKMKNVRDILRGYSEHIRHFVVIDASTIRPRTSVASVFMLQNYVDDETICECLADIYFSAVKNADADAEFRDAQFDLIRYSFIEPLFSNRNKLDMLVRYYNEIRPIGDTRNNPDYWLQLGIASTIASNFEKAENAFLNAYAREKSKKRPNPIRIDNYYARYQLEKAAWVDDPVDGFKLYKSGLSLLLKQIFRDDNRHYPFKAGRALSALAAKHYTRWSPTEQASFLGGCETLLQKAQDWQNKNRINNEDVAMMIKETNQILRTLKTSKK